MAYRRPAIEVIQQFQQAAAALALPSLPAVVVGPAYEIKDNVNVGVYDADTVDTSSYSYVGASATSIIDTAADPTEDADLTVFKGVQVTLRNAYLLQEPSSGAATTRTTGGMATTNVFSDATTGAFASFALDPTGATKYYVEVIDGPGLNAADKGKKLIIEKTSDNALKVAGEWVTGLPVAGVTYRVLKFSSTEVIDRADYAAKGITVDADSVNLPTGLTTSGDTPKKVMESDVYLSWRGLRTDFAGTLNAFTDLDSLEAAFGVGSIIPANIGPYAVYLAQQNTTTEVSFLGLGESYMTAEEQAFVDALEFLEAKDVYGLALLTENTSVHQSLKSHVEGMSVSTVGRERIGFCSKAIVSTAVIVPTSGIGTKTSAGANNGMSGTLNKTFRDPTNGAFVTDGAAAGYFLEVTEYTAVEGTQRTITPNERDYYRTAGGNRIRLGNAAFTGADVGKIIITRGSTTTANDAEHTISAIDSAVRVTVAAPPNTPEVIPSTARAWISTLDRTPAHNAADAVVAATKTWSFVNGAFTAADIGKILFMAGCATAGNNGAWLIASVVNATDITTVEAPAGNETFGGGVTQKIYLIDREPAIDTACDSVDATSRQWTFVAGAFTSEDVGREVRVAGAVNGANNNDHVIEQVLSSTVVRTSNGTTPVTESFNGLAVSITAEVRAVTPSDAQDEYILGTRHEIATVDSEKQLTLSSDPTNGFGGTLNTVKYRITRDLTKNEEASAIAGYATSLGSRRMVLTWPDVLAVSDNAEEKKVPGYFAGAVLSGMVAGLPSQQGFTNMALAGFIGRENSDDRYSDTQLDTIAGGGVLILTQPVTGAALEVRHQLTTDTSTIYYQELSVTKNLDLIARFFRGHFKPYQGIYNITESLLDLLKTRAENGIEYLKAQRVERAGAPLRAGSLSRLEESTAEPDTVEMDIDVRVPLPFNRLKLTLLV